MPSKKTSTNNEKKTKEKKKKSTISATKKTFKKPTSKVKTKSTTKKAKPKESTNQAPKQNKQAPKTDDFVEFEIAIEDVVLGEHQPRSRDAIHTRGSLTKLKESIRDIGMLQPILVQKQDDGTYLLISGERRYTSCKELGHNKIRAVLPSNRTAHALKERGKTLDELALFENLQRKNLTPIEEGRCFQKLTNLLDLKQDELGARLGLKQPYISERIGFLQLPNEVQDMIEDGQINTSQARELNRLSGLTNAGTKQIELARQITVEKLTVRKAKKLVDKLLDKQPKRDGSHLTKLGAKKAAYFIATLNDQFSEIDITELQGEEEEERLQKLADDIPSLIKKLQHLKKDLTRIIT